MVDNEEVHHHHWISSLGMLLVLVLTAPPAAAVDPSRHLTEYGHRSWQEELPQSTVHVLHQTSDGYLWIGTYAGLVRFDGVQFRVFEGDPPDGVDGRSVFALHESPSGRLWIGTDHGLMVLEDGTFRQAPLAPEAADAEVTGLAGDDAGTVWAATAAGLVRISDENSIRSSVLEIPSGPVRDVEPDGAGGVLACGSTGLWRVGGGAPPAPAEEILSGVPCTVVARSPDGRVWASTPQGVLEVSSGDVHVAGSSGVRVLALLADRHGTLWIGTEGAGVLRLDDGRLERFDRERGLSHDLVRCFLEDREGNLWVGTNGGLDQLRDTEVVTYGTRDGLRNEFVRTVIEDRSGTIWIGTDGGGLSRFQDGTFRTLTSADGLPNDSVRALAETTDGALWAGTRGGLARLDGGSITVYGRRDGIPSELVRALFVDREGRLWIGTEDAGVATFANGSFVPLDPDGPLAHADVGFFLEDAGGRMWMSTGAGLAMLDGDDLRVYTTRDGLSSDKVFSLLEDGRGGLWIGTERGLDVLRDGSIAPLSTAQGLVDNRIYATLLDDEGCIWMSSSRGIGRVPLQSLYDVLEGRATRVVMERFDTTDGMASMHCNGASQPAAWRARDGSMWFPTIRGVAVVDPRYLQDGATPPPVVIETMLVDGEPVAPTGFEIDPGWKNLEIHYAGLAFSAPEDVRFRYRLDGFDARWVEAGGRRVAYYTALPPGSYTFRVTAAVENGAWNDTGDSVAFTVRAGFWQTPWARALVVLVAVAALVGAFRLRLGAVTRRNELLEEMVAARTAELDQKHASLAEKVRQLESSEREAHEARRRASEANRAKSIFLSNMSHELRTPLNSIIGFAGILKRRLQGEVDDKLFRFVSNIHASGEHLLALINDLLDLSKIEAGRMEISVEPIHLEQITEAVLRLMHGATTQRDIVVDVDISADLPTVYADPVRLKQILFNLVSNSVKFSPDGSTVTIRARRLAADDSDLGLDSLQIDVVDRGIGIAEQHQEIIFDEFRQVDGSSGRRYEGTGLGLALVRRLVAIQGGTVRLESALGEGSTFTVLLPLRVVPHSLAADEPPALTVRPVEPDRTEQREAGSPPTVLVVEDDPIAFHQLAHSLEGDGYRVIGARSGEEALRLLEEERPDLVTLDLVLPGLDGWGVLRQLRSGATTRDIPVLIVTRKEDHDASVALGTAGFFVKPVDQDVFLQRVRELTVRDVEGNDPPTVVVVDDEPDVHELLRAVLEPAGYRVRTSSDGASGLELIRSERPDLVILDLVMPGMSGFEVAHRLRSEPATADIPIIVLTVKQLTEAERERLAGQISALITKDSGCTHRLSDTIRSLLEREASGGHRKVDDDTPDARR